MNENDVVPSYDDMTIQQQLERAARDLWSQVYESGEDYVVFMDRSRRPARVRQRPDHQFGVSWQGDDDTWVELDKTFKNPREAAFHAYQGPH